MTRSRCLKWEALKFSSSSCPSPARQCSPALRSAGFRVAWLASWIERPGLAWPVSAVPTRPPGEFHGCSTRVPPPPRAGPHTAAAGLELLEYPPRPPRRRLAEPRRAVFVFPTDRVFKSPPRVPRAQRAVQVHSSPAESEGHGQRAVRAARRGPSPRRRRRRTR